MSLKAKIEAVIYASEEPVTLVQLAGLLGHEAQAELDHRDSAQRSLLLDDQQESEESEDEDLLNSEVLSELEEAVGASEPADPIVGADTEEPPSANPEPIPLLPGSSDPLPMKGPTLLLSACWQGQPKAWLLSSRLNDWTKQSL